MDRSYASGAAGSAPAAPASPSIGYPTAGNPGTGTPPTKPGPYWYHQVTEELLAIIVGAGITPAQGTLTQLASAIQAGKLFTAAAAGTADALTAAFVPAIASLVNGMSLYVRAGSANATTTPTFTPANGTIAAKTIVKGAGAALAAGDIAGGGHWIELQYDLTLDKWVLLNPATGVTSSISGSAFQSQTYTAFTTAGATGAFTLTPTPAIGAYATGQRFRAKFHVAGNGSDTIAVSGLAAKSIKQYDSTGAKVPPVITASQLADIEYDGVDFVILDPLPSPVVASTRIAKAWVNFDGTLTGTITPRTNYNLSSVTKNGVGDYTLNFTSALADANYAIVGMTSDNGAGINSIAKVLTTAVGSAPTLMTTTAVRVSTSQNDNKTISFIVFGS